eukprot:GHVN01055237.1.p1 GENE.GHVN01055237.1~~GHVN01055237.1.p1  ORF type:complete len:610 (-),score=91.13 GHVN01055237.1:117-1946(-)
MVYTDTGLCGLATYTYLVKAVNKEGIEGPPTPSLQVHTGEPGKPSAPLQLQCQSTSKKHIALTWRHPADHGGIPIQCYQVYRDGRPLRISMATQNEIEEFEDNEVELGRSYIYAVSALHHLPAPPRETASLYAPGSQFGPNATKTFQMMDLHDTRNPHNEAFEGLLSNEITVVCQEMLSLPRLGDEKPHILLQCFNWHSAEESVDSAPPPELAREGDDAHIDDEWRSWYQELKQETEAFAEAGITMTWLPPPSESVAPQGYMPTRWYNLNSAYGTAQQLRSLNTKLRAYGITPMLDLVVNHRCGVKQDSKGQWTQFEDPDWGSWAIVEDNKQGYSGTSGVSDTGSSSDCAPDLDHTNTKVRNDILEWTKWLFSPQGASFGSLRLDMAPGYNVNYQLEYSEALGWPFCVGEYWNGCPDVLHNYAMHGGKGRIAAFDFAFYYVLRGCVEKEDFAGMKNEHGRLNGLVGRDPDHSVTFLDNHDTEHLDFVGRFAGGNVDKILQGYAVLLTHPGTPSVFWSHWASSDPRMKKTITALGQIRRQAGITSHSAVNIAESRQGLYAAFISKWRHCSGSRDAHVAIKVGCHDWCPPNVQHEWELRAFGNNFAVWKRK